MFSLNIYFIAATSIYQLLACLQESRMSLPGRRIDVGGYCLHLLTQGQRPPAFLHQPTIIVDHSLGGVEGYLLLESLAQYGQVCIYDRAGYGWSDHSPRMRTSENIVLELNTLLERAEIKPPYILVGDSFGSYNMRLYTHCFPGKVQGVVLTDGLHETDMLRLSIPLKILKSIFISGFLFSVAGAGLGLIRLLRLLGVFQFLKPQLKKFNSLSLISVTRSFCRPKHWLTMARELWCLNHSGVQLRSANDFGTIPIVNIKAHSFFHPTVWTKLIPLKQANQMRDRMHERLMQLSSDCTQLQAKESSHFIWIDQPELIEEAVQIILNKLHQ